MNETPRSEIGAAPTYYLLFCKIKVNLLEGLVFFFNIINLSRFLRNYGAGLSYQYH